MAVKKSGVLWYTCANTLLSFTQRAMKLLTNFWRLVFSAEEVGIARCGKRLFCRKNGDGPGIRTPGRLQTFGGFQDRRILLNIYH